MLNDARVTLTVERAADGPWLCRGDPGAELGLRAMAGAVAEFSQRVRTLPPVLTAGQALEHTAEHAAPTRSAARASCSPTKPRSDVSPY